MKIILVSIMSLFCFNIFAGESFELDAWNSEEFKQGLMQKKQELVEQDSDCALQEARAYDHAVNIIDRSKILYDRDIRERELREHEFIFYLEDEAFRVKSTLEMRVLNYMAAESSEKADRFLKRVKKVQCKLEGYQSILSTLIPESTPLPLPAHTEDREKE